MRIVVDLPAPFGPSRPTHVPWGTSRSSPSTAVIRPYRLTTPRSLMASAALTGDQHARGRRRGGAPSTRLPVKLQVAAGDDAAARLEGAADPQPEDVDAATRLAVVLDVGDE